MTNQWLRSSCGHGRAQSLYGDGERNPSTLFFSLVFLLELVFNCYGKERCNSSLANHVLCGLCFSAMSACGDACIYIVKLA